jgi:hypothetical protein
MAIPPAETPDLPPVKSPCILPPTFGKIGATVGIAHHPGATHMPSLFDIHDAVLSANPEADVYIVLVSSTNEYRVLPYWECELDASGLAEVAILEAVRFAENTGMGHVDAHIIDIRELRKINETTA